jgi:hypothetical protein
MASQPKAPDVEDEVDTTDEDKALEAARFILDRLDRIAAEQVRKRSQIEKRWLDNLRQYWGKYEPGTEKSLSTAQRSKSFVKLTRHKTDGWAARLSDLLFPTDEKNWGIKPTPMPELAKAAKQAQAVAEQSAAQASQAEQHDNQRAKEYLLEQAQAYATIHGLTQEQLDAIKTACEKMEQSIEDQLVESRYIIQCRDVIEDGCRIGTGILKGPLTSQKLRSEWRQRPVGIGLEPYHPPDPHARSSARRSVAFLPRHVGAHASRGGVHLRAPPSDQEGLAQARAQDGLQPRRRWPAAERRAAPDPAREP